MRWADTGLVPGSALVEAERLQRLAARQGFDWEDLAPMWAKLDEEIGELKESVDHHGQEEVEAELGDLLFMVVNLCRALNVDPQQALTATNLKFLGRMRYIETALNARGQELDDQSLETLEALWQEAKAPVSGSSTPGD